MSLTANTPIHQEYVVYEDNVSLSNDCHNRTYKNDITLTNRMALRTTTIDLSVIFVCVYIHIYMYIIYICTHT